MSKLQRLQFGTFLLAAFVAFSHPGCSDGKFDPPTDFKPLTEDQTKQFKTGLASVGLVMNAFYNSAAARTQVSSPVQRLTNIELFQAARAFRDSDVLGLFADSAAVGSYQQFVNRVQNEISSGNCKQTRIQDFSTSGNVFTFWSIPGRDIGHSITGEKCPIKLTATGKMETDLPNQDMRISLIVDYETEDSVLKAVSGIKSFHQEWAMELHIRTEESGQVASGKIDLDGEYDSERDGGVRWYLRASGKGNLGDSGNVTKGSGELRFGLVYNLFPAEIKVLADTTNNSSRGTSYFVNNVAVDYSGFHTFLNLMTQF